MDLYSNVLEKIQKSSELKKLGKYTGIPYPYGRFSEYLPSIDRESVTCLTSYSGAGKSKFARYTYVMHPYEFSVKNNYPILIDYYSLEDSAAKVFKNILCYYLYSKHKININLYDLDSKFKALSSEVITLIREGEQWLQDFSTKVRIKDTLTYPGAIFQDIVKTAESLGEIEYKDIPELATKQIVGFTPKDDTHWLILCDNLNNIDKGKKFPNPKDAMDSFIQKDCRLLYSKIFKASCVIIHQQSLEAEKQQFTNAGSAIIDKIKPSLANLGGTKEVVRSYHTVLSLFNPHKFKIKEYKGYNVESIGNNFREIEILKNNDGLDNASVPLYFDGGAEFFKELPHSERQKEELDRFYNWLSDDRLKRKNKFLLF